MTLGQGFGVFLDFDGVILDSVDIKTRAFKELFKEYEDQVVRQVMDYHRLHGGISRVEKIRHAHAEFIGNPLSEAALAEWSARFSDLVVEKVVAAPWIPGAREFLEQAHRDLPLFVVSGTPEEELAEVIRRRDMTYYFTEICGSPAKKPEHVNRVIERYGLDRELCFFVGDAFTDFDTAQETGLNFIGIQGDVEFPKDTIVLEDCRELKRAIIAILTSPREDAFDLSDFLPFGG